MKEVACCARREWLAALSKPSRIVHAPTGRLTALKIAALISSQCRCRMLISGAAFGTKAVPVKVPDLLHVILKELVDALQVLRAQV